ncbi:TPA: hypothetical protein U5D21_003603 [Yersinia enterocolitica]|nr:hypothetical protein [Yersinia enterocolitica]
MDLKHRLIIGLVAFVLGVPSSIYGFQWIMFKLSIQMVNCSEDISRGVSSLLPNDQLQRDFSLVATEFEKCRKNIDIKKGSVEFIKEEIGRGKKYSE